MGKREDLIKKMKPIINDPEKLGKFIIENSYVFSPPHRKIRNAMIRQYGLDISPATILDLTRRAADAVQSEYDTILNRVRNAPILYVGETSIDV